MEIPMRQLVVTLISIFIIIGKGNTDYISGRYCAMLYLEKYRFLGTKYFNQNLAAPVKVVTFFFYMSTVAIV